MAVTPETPAPYAPASAVLEIVNRYRRGLPAPINAEVLGRAGISDSLISRTLQALVTLDLINEDGAPSNHLEGLRRAPEPEFQSRLADWLNAAYADVLSFIDPATADEGAIRDAFRNYNPVGQQPRMVSLFIALYAAAGVRAPERAAPRATKPSTARPRTVTKTPAKLSPGWTKVAKNAALGHTTANLPPALAGLMASLPQNGDGWTQTARDKFVALFGSTLDFCFPIVTQADIDNRNAAEQ